MQSSMSQMPLSASGQGRVSGAFRSQLVLLLLPVLILLLVGASSLGLQIASHQGLELAYPTPNVHITSMPSGTITVGDQVSFAADSPGRDLVYKWDFGDGGTATGPSVNYTYQQLNESNNFTYTVTVTVSDVLGRTSSSSTQVRVLPPPPTANFSYTEETDYYGNYTQIIDFNASGSSIGTQSATYNWDFGDSATDSTSNPTDSHTYASTGSYTVTLTITDSAGQTSNAYSLTITVQ